MPVTFATVAPHDVSPRRPVPTAIARPEYVDRPRPEPFTGSEVKDADTIARMRVAGRIAAQAMEVAAAAIAPGVTTDEIDAVGHEFLLDHGAYPSTLGYKAFPKSLCTSVNEVICHGIGRSFHSGLFVPHFDSPGATEEMVPGMTFTIEPMITLGTTAYDLWDDGWTAVTKDKRWTAQFEHTILVTDSGYEILTLP